MELTDSLSCRIFADLDIFSSLIFYKVAFHSCKGNFFSLCFLRAYLWLCLAVNFMLGVLVKFFSFVIKFHR